MDKHITGKWQREGFNEFEILNIFDEAPLRMKMSVASSGYYNFEPNCVYEKDGYFCFELNDEQYRMVYRLKYADGNLEGHITQFGNDNPVKYIRLSEQPEDGAYKYYPINIYIPETFEPRIGALKRLDYDRGKTDDCTTEYELFGEIPTVLSKYDYEKYIAGFTANDDGLAFSLLDFVCDHFGHNGSGGLSEGRKIEDVIAFCEEHDNKTNCRGLSIMLAGILRLNGIKAQHVTCMPYEPRFMDCHVVVDCLLPSGDRIMLDPTYRLYLKDSKGKYVSLQHLREMLTNGEPIIVNENAGYNGKKFDFQEDLQEYRDYMTKNTFMFSRGLINADGNDENEKRAELIPQGYPIDQLPEWRREVLVYNDSEFWKM